MLYIFIYLCIVSVWLWQCVCVRARFMRCLAACQLKLPLPPADSLPHAAMAPPAACHVCNACRTGAAAAEQEEEEGGNAEQRLRKLSTGPMILACH